MKQVNPSDVIWKPFKRMGQGSFANVYQITLKSKNKKKFVAIKVLDEILVNINDLQNEIVTLSLLSDLIDNMIGFNGVLTLTDENERPDTMDLAKGTIHRCLIMELMEKTLEDLIFDTSAKLELSLILNIGQQIARGMAEIHSFGVLHRDLKPANILLKKSEDNNYIVKISDFGLIRRDSNETMKKTAIGTKVYLPPELRNIIGQQTDLVSTKSDVYSFGVTLWEMLTRRHAYMTQSTNSNNRTSFGSSNGTNSSNEMATESLPLEKIPEQFLQLVQRCLNPNPILRPDFTTIITSI